MPLLPRKTTGRAGTSLLPAALSLPVSATGLVATLKGPGVRADGSMRPRGVATRDPFGEREYRGLEDATDPSAFLSFRSLVFTADSRFLVASTSDARSVVAHAGNEPLPPLRRRGECFDDVAAHLNAV